VNLMGDHTDYVGGLVLPMAIQLGTTVEGEPGGDRLVVRSAWAEDVIDVGLDELTDPARVRAIEPGWARPIAGVAAELQPTIGFRGTITTTLPVGAGLSSSAALEVATALALGFEGSAHELAALARRGEHLATGVPCGIMDPLASATGRAGHALRIDCATGSVTPVRFPDDLVVLVVHSGVDRHLDRTPYADRVAEATAGVERRARHVRSENERVEAFASGLAAGDRRTLGEILASSHASLRDDAEVSIPEVDDLVDDIVRQPGVVGARLTGAGFGGCVVALLERGAPPPDLGGRSAWLVEASAGATCA
jgi:galactokinase